MIPLAGVPFKIMRLQQGGAAKERKLRLEHSPMPNGDEILQSAFVRFFNQRDNVAPAALSENHLAVRKS